MMPERKLSLRQLDKQQRILSAALKVFAESGYSAASIDAIALEAEVSKPTLYMYFGSKEHLFEAMMVVGRDAMLEPFEHSTGDMVRDFHDFAGHYADIVMRPEFLSLARLIIGEAHRFPDIGPGLSKGGSGQIPQPNDGLSRRAEGKSKAGFQRCRTCCSRLLGLDPLSPRNKALHVPDDLPTRAEIRRYLENGLRVLLKAYSTNPCVDLALLAEITGNMKVAARARKTD